MSGCRFVTEGKLTDGKREWIVRQVEALEAANRQLVMEMRSMEVQIKSNGIQAQRMRDFLKENPA